MAGLKKRKFSAGEVVFRQGEASIDLYFIQSGSPGGTLRFLTCAR